MTVGGGDFILLFEWAENKTMKSPRWRTDTIPACNVFEAAMKRQRATLDQK